MHHDSIANINMTVLQLEPQYVLTNETFKDTKHKLENKTSSGS
jgi:hypothetical protein